MCNCLHVSCAERLIHRDLARCGRNHLSLVGERLLDCTDDNNDLLDEAMPLIYELVNVSHEEFEAREHDLELWADAHHRTFPTREQQLEQPHHEWVRDVGQRRTAVPHGKRGTQWRRDVIRLSAERYDVDGLGEMQQEESEIGWADAVSHDLRL
jgi:hypothetical protein